MTRDDIIRMAREAGHPQPGMDALFFERFAALVEKEVKREASFDRADLWLGRMNEAIKQEREACAKVLLGTDVSRLPDEWKLAFTNIVWGYAAAIRARGTP